MDEMKFSLSDDEVIWVCQYCGIHNPLWVDLTVTGKQDFVEDCRICCRPNRIIIQLDEDENIQLDARPLDE